MTASPRRMLPPVISSSPATIRSSVVLPQPEGPTSTIRVPSSIVRSTARTASVYDVWEEVEHAAGEQLVHLTGGIDMFGRDAPLGRDVYAAGMLEGGAEVELLTGADVSSRWPQLAPPCDVPALAHARAGFV